MATKVKLKSVRLSFNDLFEAAQFQGQGAFRYRAVFLLSKNSDNVKTISVAMQEEAKKMWPDNWQKMMLAFKGNAQKSCITDGDLSDTDGHAGNMVLAANRKQKDGRPLIIDRNKSPLTEADGKPYSGCYVNATVEIWAQDGVNKGIRCALQGVQFDRDGDAFSGGVAPSEDDFDDLSGGGDFSDTPVDSADDESLI